MADLSNVNIKEMTPEQIMAFMSQFKELEKTVKQAKKEGLIPKEEKKRAEKEIIPEVALFLEQIKAVYESNIEVIRNLFNGTKSEADPVGQIGINFKVTDEFGIQLLSETARKTKVEANKAAKRAKEAEKKEKEETETPKPDAP
ncbi:MAG TPA: hypothetical protein DDX29_01285 [Clostridiales bacterium]|nr:hypothetical protein [Clostridiales bacterium]